MHRGVVPCGVVQAAEHTFFLLVVYRMLGTWAQYTIRSALTRAHLPEVSSCPRMAVGTLLFPVPSSPTRTTSLFCGISRACDGNVAAPSLF